MSLREIFVLDELERQAKIFDSSFTDALAAARADDADHAWRHVQAALFAAIVVQRTIRRHDRIRVELGVPTDEAATPLNAVYRVRNHLEHIDQRFADVLDRTGAVMVVDWYLTDGHLVTSGEGGHGGRAFSAESGLLFYDDDVLDMFQLDVDMLRLAHNVRDRRTELVAALPDRSTFGGGALKTFPPRDDVRMWWEAESASLRESLVPPADDDPRVQMWMQIEG